MSCKSGAGSVAEAMHNYGKSSYSRDGYMPAYMPSVGLSYDQRYQPASSRSQYSQTAAPMSMTNNFYNYYSNRNAPSLAGPSMNPSMSSMHADDNYYSSFAYQQRQCYPEDRRMMHTYQKNPNEDLDMHMNFAGNKSTQGSFHHQSNWAMPYPRSAFSHHQNVMNGTNGKKENPAATSSEVQPYLGWDIYLSVKTSIPCF